MDKPRKPREYRVQGRYEYWAIDLYEGDSLRECVDTFRTRKQANLIANALNSAYQAGRRDMRTERDDLDGVY